MNQFDKMIMFLDQAWHLRSEIVPCLVGPVGIGKTAAVRQHAANVGAKNVVTIIASQILPSEVSGITMPDAETKSMEIYDHYKLSSLEDGDILFFDELLEADQSVLSACLTLIESRMMMSGRMLPDIQIIAATNPTIQPSSLRENIRQRFMFMRFGIDQTATFDYILERTGISVPDSVLNQMCETNSDYNILSPRSLTKLCLWIKAAPYDQLDKMAVVINDIWKSSIGSQLVKACRVKSSKQQVLDKVAELAPAAAADHGNFKDCTFEEMMAVLQDLPEWKDIEDKLAHTTIETTQSHDSKVSF